MVLRGDELISAAEILCDQEGFRATVKGSAAGGLMTGTAAMLTGVALGPVGLLIGGIGGSIGSYLALKGSYKPLSEVIRNLAPMEKQLFINHLRMAIGEVDAGDALQLVAIIMSNGDVKMIALNAIRSFAQSQLNLSIS